MSIINFSHTVKGKTLTQKADGKWKKALQEHQSAENCYCWRPLQLSTNVPFVFLMLWGRI